MKRKMYQKIMAVIMTLTLLAGSLGSMSLQSYAEEANTEGKKSESVFYVGGESASDDNDGLSAEMALSSLKAAYEKIPADNEKTTILICGKVTADFDQFVPSEGRRMYLFPAHSGEVILTSKTGEEDYTDAGSLNFPEPKDKESGKRYCLQGNTTFENIRIDRPMELLHAHYHQLTLGDGITGTGSYYPAQQIYLGINYHDVISNTAKNAIFSMKSGNIQSLYGGSNFYNQSAKKVDITVYGGNIEKLYGTGLGSASSFTEVSIQIHGGEISSLYGCTYQDTVTGDGLKISLKEDASVGSVAFSEKSGDTTASISGGKVLELQGATEENTLLSTVSAGFDTLKLQSSTFKADGTKEFWSTIEKISMTDDSSITFSAVPSKNIRVTAEKAGEEFVQKMLSFM